MSKYGARKTKIDGIVFDSRAEAEFYLQLKERDDIEKVELQPEFTLLEGFDHPAKRTKAGNPSKVRKVSYVADFLVTQKDGEKLVIDVKGFKTPVFRLKAKMFLAKFGIPLYLAKKRGGKFVLELY